MSRDDIEQLEYIENWKKKQEKKRLRREKRKADFKAALDELIMFFFRK